MIKTEAPPITGRHFYQFYQGREDLFRVAVPFLRLGLENREACLWIVSSAVGVLEAIEAFQREYDLSRYINDNQLLILPAERWYLERGRFSERKALDRVKKFIEEKKRMGFTAFRAVGDLGWLRVEDWPKVQSYEAKVHHWIQSLSITKICFYPIQHCTLIQTKDVVDGHDGVFLTKQ